MSRRMFIHNNNNGKHIDLITAVRNISDQLQGISLSACCLMFRVRVNAEAQNVGKDHKHAH